jgi:uncharacterized membrane protein YgcG
MKRWWIWGLVIWGWIVSYQKAAALGGYTIENFQSQITLNQDTSLSIEEKIEVNFEEPKRGIIRVVPYIYHHQGQTINGRLTVEEVVDENGEPQKFTTNTFNQSKRIKIGDPETTIWGRHTYLIRYRAEEVVRTYEGEAEIYWNITGNEWDTTIKTATATIKSPFGKIVKVDCFGGIKGSGERKCESQITEGGASIEAAGPIGPQSDLTVVARINGKNELVFPGRIKKITNWIADNWGYGASVIPLLVMIAAWWEVGRDTRYQSENVFVKPEDGKDYKVLPWERPHLPQVYSPINGLSPAEVGVILDEKLDLKDIVAELMEMTRLGYIKIEKIKKKGLFGSSDDYVITELKNGEELKDYQKYLLDQMLDSGVKRETRSVKISELKNVFYQYLEELRNKVYQNMVKEELLVENPEETKNRWLAVYFGTMFLAGGLIWLFTRLTYNFGPIATGVISGMIGLVIVQLMPRKTAWGYSLHRQAVGLREYLKMAKWREEIAEKHLFLEEMLPLAIALGVVDRLAKDMAGLGVEPPRYFGNESWVKDLGRFNTITANNLATAPESYKGANSWSYSGRSSWSGGSGFSGGSSGGGFGGGGGSSW